MAHSSLTLRAWISLAALAVVMAAVLFGSAGTFRYWEAWLYLLIFIGGSALTTLDLLERDPELLERRMHAGPTAEKEPAQRVIMSVTSLGFLALLAVPALDQRFHWSTVPFLVIVTGDLLVGLGLYFIVLVYHENTYTAATVQVAEGQTVISTGPYAIVRHPMYASAFLYLAGTPLALGSYFGMISFVCIAPFIVWRMFDEERLLARELRGYIEYQNRVRYRLVPFLW